MGNRLNSGQRKARRKRAAKRTAKRAARARPARVFTASVKRPAHRPRSAATGTFAKWLDACGLTVAEVASRIGVTPAVIYNYRVGRFKPGREASAKIEEISGGEVPVASWDAA